MRQRWLWATVLLIGAALGLAAAGPQVESEFTDEVTLTVVDGDAERGQVRARVADDPLERHRGLSGVESLGPNAGMVFVYPAAGERAFVMREMEIPLDILFVGPDRRITAIYHATADDDRTFREHARWVIEVNRGYAAAHDLSVGDRVDGLPD